MKGIEPFMYLRIGISATLGLFILDGILLGVLSFKEFSKGLYLIVISGFEKSFLTSFTFSLYIFGLRLVPLHNRTKMV
jgi:hypothetical protein